VKAHFMSDLHLEFDDLTLAGGELLILAGDVLVADVFRTERTDKSATRLRYRFSRFLREELGKYDRVLYVLGNHEHYNGVFEDTAALVRSQLPSNAQLLCDETVTIGDVTVFGGTLWTSMNDEDPLTISTVAQGMNDFRIVYRRDGGRLRPEDVVIDHKRTLKRLADAYAASSSSKFVVVTHHAPTPLSCDARYKGSHRENGAYYSNLGDCILERPKIATWIHGHMHLPVDYRVGECRVVSNPRGYHPHEKSSHDFVSTREIEL